VPWPRDGQRPRRAGVSAFGVSGTNAHIIVEEFPAGDVAVADGGPVGRPPLMGHAVLPWVVSGRSVAGLAGQAGRLAGWMADRPDVDLADVGFSLIATRSAFEHRAVVTGTDREELAAGLAAVAAGQPAPGVVTGVAGDPGRVVFVFPGQGGQWAGMGRELAKCCPAFATRLAECGRALAPWVDWDLEQVLTGAAGAPGIERADVVQPVLWAVMVALAGAWQAAGVEPDAVAGHSQGEIAAATVAGILTVDDAARVVALRSKALAGLAGGWGMLSVAESARQVQQRLAGYGDRLAVAAVNGPTATVVSGEAAALEELATACATAGVRTKPVPVDYASHCAQVEAVREEILGDLAGLTPGRGRVPMVSAVTGEVLPGDQADAGYWYASLREPVQFERTVRALAASGHSVFIEVSPHPVLIAPITETLEDAGSGTDAAGPVVAGTLRRGDGGPSRLLASLAEVYVRGIPVDWATVLGGGRRIELPPYAFQRKRYWVQSSPVRGDVTAAGLGAVRHPLLGAAVELAGGSGLVLTGRVSLQSQPWLADHAVAGVALFPATAFVELAVQAGEAARCGRVEELALAAPLVLPADGAVQLQVTVGEPGEGGHRPIEVHARGEGAGTDEPWTRHASGLLAPAPPDTDLATGFAVWPPPGAVPVDTAGFYEGLAAAGYGYGPAFQMLRAAWRDGGDVLAEVAMGEEAAAGAAAFGLHPALLDAALHASALAAGAGDAATGEGSFRMPFAWTGVSVHAAGAAALRVRLSPQPGGGLSVAAADSAGMPVISVRSLVLRPVPAGLLAGGSEMREALFAEQWAPVQEAADGPLPGRWAVAGAGSAGLAAQLAGAGVHVQAYPDLGVLAAAAGAGEQVPEVVLACAGAGWDSPDGGADGYGAGDAAGAAGRVLGLVQQWLAAEALVSSRLVVLTRGAVACRPGEGVADLPGAAVWGLVRSAQSEDPGRLVLADLPAAADAGAAALRALAAAGSGEPELAVRDGGVYARRLDRPGDGLAPPEGGMPWRLEVTEPGRLDTLALMPCPQAAAPLQAGQVRVAVRAAGVGMRDVLTGLGADPGVLGSEIAGVVTETGPGVAGLAPGDRVMGLAAGGFGPVVIADARLLVPVPSGWSFAAAAAVPMAYVTAWYALTVVARARAGQRIVVHAAAGGVGMAAVAVARHLGLEVYGTASSGKQAALAAMGLDAGHVASSRTTAFEQAFLAASGGTGMDIVLSALPPELAGASLRLMPRGGTFVDLSTTGIGDPAAVARDHHGVSYQALDLAAAGPERLGQVLEQVAGLLAAGTLPKLPMRAWDVRRAGEAFAFMAAARHTGKVVLAMPPDPAAPRQPGTVLVTGGTGTLGTLVATHLAATGRARAVVLASRSGLDAAGAATAAAAVAARGAQVQVVACDVADRDALAALLAQLPAAPLTAVVHAAGVIDDAMTRSLTPAQIDTVLRPKADAAWHLHELTRDLDLEAFILFSSAAATFGGAGQGNYTAGNAFLDGLAAHRRAAGLPAVSLAWGNWVHRAGIGRNLSEKDLARINRSGIAELTAEEGLALLDVAIGRDEPTLIPARLDLAGIRARVAQGTEMPSLLRTIIGPVRPTMSAAATPVQGQALQTQLAGLPSAERDRVLTDLVRAHVAAVLGHASPEAVQPDQAFREIGFDSLTAVELRNRLGMSTGLHLPATLIFDYPTLTQLSGYLNELLLPEASGDLDPSAEEDEIRRLLVAIPLARLRDAGLLKSLLRLSRSEPTGPVSDGEDEDSIDVMDAATLVRMAVDNADI
jgi:acyl transferase domain-containing protein/NADPH:quinone reductase-like Zn-dependent oxidoreductase/acyl carrier protein